MAIVTLEIPHLSPEAKKRLADRILYEMQKEGIPVATTVLMFRPLSDDLYVDGILVEAEPAKPAPAAPLFSLAATPIHAISTPAPAAPVAKGKPGRKPKSTVEAARDLLRGLLADRRSINSFEAQKAFDKAEVDCNPALLRRLFQELEKEGLVARTGNKRGTRYVLKVPEGEKGPAAIKLVKAEHLDN
jgi:hypothetical protein